MKSSIYVETPWGVFKFARTDLSKGTSCSQCALLGLGKCHLMKCRKFDNERYHFHLVHRYVVKGGCYGGN